VISFLVLDMREKLSVPEDHLRSCLLEHYGLTPGVIEFLPLGLDTRSAIYRVMSEHGVPYLLKAKYGSLYEPACLVPRRLNDLGISAVVAPVFTKRRGLWARFDDWTVIVYPFIDGDANWTGMTDEHWKEVGAVFKRIHRVGQVGQVGPLSQDFQLLRRETFDSAEYARQMRSLEVQYIANPSDRDVSERDLRSSWMAHQPAINAAITFLEGLAPVLRRRSGPYVICHADLHPANLIRDRAGRVFVIDWDDVMLAPKERDFIFVGDAPADGSAELAPFFQGYGETEIDWIALAYYRWERIIQDLIECARTVFLRDDLGEEIKADAVQLFDRIVAGGSDFQAAYAAAAHIPADLHSHLSW
jgi:spectinomycin phosphotransferase